MAADIRTWYLPSKATEPLRNAKALILPPEHLLLGYSQDSEKGLRTGAATRTWSWRKIILSITKVVWEIFFSYVHMMGHLHYQSNWTWSYLGDTLLGMPVRAFPESFNWDHSRMRKVPYNVLESQTEQNTRNWRTCTSFPCSLFPFLLRTEQAAATCSPTQDPLVPVSWWPHNCSLNALRPRAQINLSALKLLPVRCAHHMRKLANVTGYRKAAPVSEGNGYGSSHCMMWELLQKEWMPQKRNPSS